MEKNNTSKFKLEKIKILGLKEYNLIKNTDCSICRCNLNMNSIFNQELEKTNNKDLKYSLSESIISEGICGHTFHYECINPWIKKNLICPICMTIWNYKED
jgi:RING-box protein 1